MIDARQQYRCVFYNNWKENRPISTVAVDTIPHLKCEWLPQDDVNQFSEYMMSIDLNSMGAIHGDDDHQMIKTVTLKPNHIENILSNPEEFFVTI